MNEPWRTIFLVLVVLFLFGFVKACDAEAKEVKPPVAVNDRVTIELIATMEDGKVRVYRLVDYPSGIFNTKTCYITVGELHGKTVAMVCP